MTIGERILITSKCPPKDLRRRKPTKECYCNTIKKKMDEMKNVKKSCWPCDYCMINYKILSDPNETEDEIPSRSLSKETLKKLGKINYTPRSEFLKRVQNSYRYSENNLSVSRHSLENDGKLSELKSKLTRSKCNCTSKEVNNQRDHQQSHQDEDDDEFSSSQIKTIFVRQTPSNKSSKTMLKKTLTSKIAVDCGKKLSDKTVKPSKISRTISQSNCDNERCSVNKKTSSKKSNEKLRNSLCNCQCQSKLIVKCKGVVDDDDVELRKFREKNYFDTHGSCQTLHSYEQFRLNDRLFPEPAHNNFVLSIPVNDSDDDSGTIHYFSKYIVTRNKDLKIKSKRSSCPLVDHSLNIKPTLNKHKPNNSLALEFHKA